jgi:SAM-dependent methyltransferase
MNRTSFDDLTDVYEATIDWPRRLSNEGPFFRALFDQFKVKRVADVACGTGRHAAMFHSWGLDVDASDISAKMIQRAKDLFGEPPGLHWAVSSFEQPRLAPETLDAAICIGNSLALAADMTSVAAALRALFDMVRRGGLVVVHVLNLWKVPPGPCVWQKIITRPSLPGAAMSLKGVHRCGEIGYVELVVVPSDADDTPIRSESVPFLGLTVDQLKAAAIEHGTIDVAFFGNHQHQPYDAVGSADLIMVAKKG